MCDLLLRLPLSIFLKVFNVSYVIPELEEFSGHPIKRHYLVRHLPARLRNALVVARRYIFSIHEVMLRLCYVGLIQFGPQRLKEKDQVCIKLCSISTSFQLKLILQLSLFLVLFTLYYVVYELTVLMVNSKKNTV